MKENYYFDNAATTWPKPEEVYQFMDSFFRSHGVNPGRSGHELAVEAEQMIFSTRRMLADFFGHSGDPNRVVFTQNATDSLNIALRGLLTAGDHLITTRLEHNAVLRSANHLARDFSIDVSLVEPNDQGYLQLDAIEQAITKKTTTMVVNHASNVTGAVQDLKSIAALAKKHKLHLIVDTAQTAGVVDIDMSWGIDIVTFTGHKGLFGPMGIGGLIVAEGVEIKPMRFGGTGVDSASPYQPDVYPHRLEAGTLSMPGIAGLNAAQKWLLKLGGDKVRHATGDAAEDALSAAGHSHRAACIAAIDHIHQIEMQHVSRIWDHLESLAGVQTLGRLSDGEHIAVVSFTVDGMPAQQVAEMLDADYHVCVRAGLQCAPQVHQVFNTFDTGGAIRISPGYFTEEADVDHLLVALSEICSN